VLGWGTVLLLVASCFTVFFGLAIAGHREAALALDHMCGVQQQEMKTEAEQKRREDIYRRGFSGSFYRVEFQ